MSTLILSLKDAIKKGHKVYWEWDDVSPITDVEQFDKEVVLRGAKLHRLSLEWFNRSKFHYVNDMGFKCIISNRI